MYGTEFFFQTTDWWLLDTVAPSPLVRGSCPMPELTCEKDWSLGLHLHRLCVCVIRRETTSVRARALLASVCDCCGAKSGTTEGGRHRVLQRFQPRGCPYRHRCCNDCEAIGGGLGVPKGAQTCQRRRLAC
jgi:hypothetical protein